MFDYLKNQIEAGYSSLGPFVGAFKGLYNTGLPPVLRNALLLDIETGGLNRWAPILQIGIADTNSLDMAQDLTKQLAKGEQIHVFPFANVRDVLKVDEQGQKRKPSWKVKPHVIKTAESFQEEFGDWAFRPENAHLQVKELYEGLGGEVTQEHLKTLRTQGYIDVAGTRWHNPAHVAQKLANRLEDAANRGMSLVAANNPFEGQRLGLFFQAWTKGNIDHIKRLFESTPSFSGQLSLMTGESSPAFQFAQSKIQSSSDFIKLRPLLNELPAKGIRATDVQTFARMLYSGAGKLGLSPEHADIFSGTSVEMLSHSLLEKKEQHAALADALYQMEILGKYLAPSTDRLYTMAQGLEEGADFATRTKGFLSAAGGLFDTNFIKSLKLANQRSFVRDKMKERNIYRTMAQLSATLDVLADNKSIPGYSFRSSPAGEVVPVAGEFFQLTKTGLPPEERTMADGTKYLDWSRTTRQDKELLTNIVNKAQAGASRKQLENWLLNQTLDTNVVKGYEKTYTFSKLRSILDDVKQSVSSGEKVYDDFITADKNFTQGLLDSMDNVSWNRGDYLSWFTGRYRKTLGAIGLIGFTGYQVAKSTLNTFDQGDPALSQYLAQGPVDPKAYGEVPLFESTGASIIGYSEYEIYKKMTEKEDFDWKTKQILRSGNIVHKHGEVQRLREGKSVAGEYYVGDPEHAISSYVDVVYQRPDGGYAPSDIKTASPRKMESIRKRGPDPRNVSQLNFYMAQMGSTYGFLEYENRIDPSDKQDFRIEFDPELLQRDLEKLERVRSRIRYELSIGKLNYEELPTKETMAARALKGQQLTANIERMASRPFNPILETQYQLNLAFNRAIEAGYVPDNNNYNRRSNYSERSHRMASAQNETLARFMQHNPGRYHDR